MAVGTSSARLDATTVESKHRSEIQNAWRRFSTNRVALVGLAMLALILLIAILAPVIAPYDPINDMDTARRGCPPSPEHWFGCDHLGRDLLSRVIYGARIALTVGIGATLISVTIGVVVGALAGFLGGWTDAILSRLVDTLMSFPIIALLIVLAAVLGPSLLTTVVVIGVTVWSRYARVVRADVMSLRERDFIVAAYASGVRNWRIIWRHLVPNALGPVIVLASLGIGGIIILEAALSFLGLGVRPPAPSWGAILADGRAYILRYPHISFFPGVMIVFTVLAFNFVGDGLRDALDPKE
ncbi:MAG TPA: peptide ABC transporter permease [Chloroflexi bacterium]|nr:peptide ABC transporter permease [Chloroflexota bacterium]HHW85004.1 ABC transporter permease [Chloroflexota bacterium]